jgi:hypothetical protein
VRFLSDTEIHFSSAFAVALDKAHRTGGFLLVRATSMIGRIVPFASVIATGQRPATGKVGTWSSQRSDCGHEVSILMAAVGVDAR